MNIQISKKLGSISSYAFAEVDNEVAKLKAAGITPIDFGVGDPKEPTPKIVRNAVKSAVDKRKSSGYPSYNGSEEFRHVVAGWNKRRFGINLDYQNEIASSIGAKEAVFNFPQAILDEGDYVIAPNPGYPPYEKGALFAGGRTYFSPLLKENSFLMDLSKIPKEIVKKAKILWINYPNNPTGAVATEAFFKEAVDFGHDNNIIIASDECYSEIYYGEKPHSILEYSREGTVVFQSLSKRSAMTGYRIGWAAGDENIISAFKKLKPNIDSGTPTFIQDAAIAALNDESHVETMRKSYREKRNIMINALTSAGMEDCTPGATLYIWQKTPNKMGSVDFAKRLLQKDIGIVVTPGAWISNGIDGFNPGASYVRFALVPTVEETNRAAKRIMENLK